MTLNDMASIFSDRDQVALISAAMVALAVFLAGLALLLKLHDTTHPVAKRLRSLMVQDTHTPSLMARLHEALKPLHPFLIPRRQTERETTQQQLIHAGFHDPEALPIYYAIRILSLVSLPVGVMLTHPWLRLIPEHQVNACALAAAALGLLLPGYVLQQRIEKRQRRLRNAFPEALDLLIVCTEAGLGLNAALIRVSEELGGSHPELALELDRINAEIRSGMDRPLAFHHLYERTGIDDFRSFSGIINQSLRFGSGIADTLRIHAEDLRDKRMQYAEEQAAKIGTKMIFPLVLCIFPGFFVVAIGPAVIRLMAVFSSLR